MMRASIQPVSRLVLRVALSLMVAGATVAVPIGVSAQAGMGTGATFERYSFSTPAALDIESVTLLSVPFAARFDAGRGFVFGVRGGWARGELSREDGTQASLSGLTDTELTAGFQLPNGSAAITGLVLLPTGAKSLTLDEMFVAGTVAADVLPFAITDWGTGGGAGINAAVAAPVGGFAIGLSAGFVMARTFQPLAADEFDYRPGNQFHLRGAIDRTIGRSTKLAARVDWRQYGADQGDGQNVFQTGDRFQVVTSLDFAVGESSAIVYSGWLARGEGEYVTPADVLPAQNLFYAGFGMRSSLGRSVLQPSIDARIFDADDGNRHGYTIGIGTSVELPAGGTTIVPDARFRFGSMDASDGADSGFTGINLGLILRFGSSAK